MNILNAKIGDTFIKGKRKRTFRGFHFTMVLYSTTNRNNITGVSISKFNKWLEGAEKI